MKNPTSKPRLKKVLYVVNLPAKQRMWLSLFCSKLKGCHSHTVARGVHASFYDPKHEFEIKEKAKSLCPECCFQRIAIVDF
jgi:hypothetical protein